MASSAAHPDQPDGDLAAEDQKRIWLRVLDFVRERPWFFELRHDLLQDASLRWWQVQQRFDPTRGSRTTYLRWVTDNAIRQRIRQEVAQRGRPAGALSLDWQDDAHSALADRVAAPGSEEARVIQQVFNDGLLEQLSPRDAYILRRLLDDRSIAEIADELGLHRDTVNEARKRIRRYVQDSQNP